MKIEIERPVLTVTKFVHLKPGQWFVRSGSDTVCCKTTPYRATFFYTDDAVLHVGSCVVAQAEAVTLVSLQDFTLKVKVIMMTCTECASPVTKYVELAGEYGDVYICLPCLEKAVNLFTHEKCSCSN